jgi:hypothetical protein
MIIIIIIIIIVIIMVIKAEKLLTVNFTLILILCLNDICHTEKNKIFTVENKISKIPPST